LLLGLRAQGTGGGFFLHEMLNAIEILFQKGKYLACLLSWIEIARKLKSVFVCVFSIAGFYIT
jgi:hypothetical protein